MLTGLLCASLLAFAAKPVLLPQIHVVGQWQVEVSSGIVRIGEHTVKVRRPVRLTIAAADMVEVKGEKLESLPLYDANASPWARGAKLRGLTTSETTAADMLVPESVVVKSVEGGTVFKLGTDYALEPRWATFGRLPNGSIPPNKPVQVDYRYGRSRLDAIVIDLQGKVSLLQGAPHTATPMPPAVGTDSALLARVWVPGRLTALAEDNLYPILEAIYPTPNTTGHAIATRLLPKTWAKLQNGRPLSILAWGDSVTAGGEASDVAHQYQSRFVAMLQEGFPHASLNLTTVAWGGRNSDSFLNEPPGSAYNFAEKVLQPHPDLIVMEFVNDAYLTPEQVETRYTALQKRFDAIEAEWIILTPHFVRPDWMGATTVRVEQDPRPYTAGVRAFAARHQVALADASLRWGHLVKEGLPYTTLLRNSINHPDDRGHEIFALALMELFKSGK